MPLNINKIRDRGYLPHWESDNGIYAVTFRLADSLPNSVLDAYRKERQSVLDAAAKMQRPLSPQEQIRLDFLYSERIESYLDQGGGECLLRDPRIGQLVFDAIQHFHPTRYSLATWCVMPNHAHVLFQPKSPNSLGEILQSWKSFTSHRANKILSRSGIFWMPEYYDHLVRDEADYYHQHNYIMKNPAKAGLKDWPWVATFLEE